MCASVSDLHAYMRSWLPSSNCAPCTVCAAACWSLAGEKLRPLWPDPRIRGTKLTISNRGGCVALHCLQVSTSLHEILAAVVKLSSVHCACCSVLGSPMRGGIRLGRIHVSASPLGATGLWGAYRCPA